VSGQIQFQVDVAPDKFTKLKSPTGKEWHRSALRSGKIREQTMKLAWSQIS